MAGTGMVKTITGSTKITYHADGPEDEAWEADFTPPFKKLDLMKGLEAELNVKLPDPSTLHTAGRLWHFTSISACPSVWGDILCSDAVLTISLSIPFAPMSTEWKIVEALDFLEISPLGVIDTVLDVCPPNVSAKVVEASGYASRQAQYCCTLSDCISYFIFPPITGRFSVC